MLKLFFKVNLAKIFNAAEQCFREEEDKKSLKWVKAKIIKKGGSIRGKTNKTLFFDFFNLRLSNYSKKSF